jgi:hypothetical protein
VLKRPKLALNALQRNRWLEDRSAADAAMFAAKRADKNRIAFYKKAAAVAVAA